MYLSHAVRTIRDDPMAGESVDLVVTLGDDAADASDSVSEATGDPEAFGASVSALGGAVVADLQFSAVHVRLPEPAVADLCALDGIERIETAETLRLVGEEAADATGRAGAAETPDGGDDAATDPERRPGSGT